MQFFWRNGFFMQTNAISSILVRYRKNLCETPKHDRILKRNALRCHRPGHFFPRICWTPVRMDVRMSPFSRYSSSRVIMCTITCNQMLLCLVENKELHFFCSPATIVFSLERRNANSLAQWFLHANQCNFKQFGAFSQKCMRNP
jgi:hypothetical protein